MRPAFTRGRYTISIHQKKHHHRREYFLTTNSRHSAQHKKILDATIQSVCKRMLEIIKNLSSEDQGKLVRLAKNTPLYKGIIGIYFGNHWK